MGEANRRRAADPLYGKVSKANATRGIVISSPLRIEDQKLQTSGELDAQELRFSLLFWDELVWPQSRMISFSNLDHPDVKFLEAAKILSCPPAGAYSGDVATSVAQMMLSKFEELETRQPGKWSLAQGERAFNLIAPAGVPGALIELHRAIPVPKDDVPLAEILEFKHRRRDELVFFREHLDSLSQEIAQSAAPEETLAKHLSDMDRACANLILVGKEWQFPMHLSDFKASLNIDSTKLVLSSAAVFASATPMGLPAAAAAAGIAALGSLLNVKADIGFRAIKRPRSPYRYAYHIDRELG